MSKLISRRDVTVCVIPLSDEEVQQHLEYFAVMKCICKLTKKCVDGDVMSIGIIENNVS